MVADSTPLYHRAAWQALMAEVYRVEPCGDIGTVGGALVSPAFRCRSILSGRKLTNMPFLFYPEPDPDGERMEAVLRQFVAHAAETPGMRVEFKTRHAFADESVAACGLDRQAPSLESILALTGSAEDVRARYHRSLRRYTRSAPGAAAEAGITFRIARELAEVRGFYDVLAESYRTRHRMVFHPWSLFAGLCGDLTETVEFRLAFEGTRVVGGVVVFYDGPTARYVWGAVTERHRGLRLSMVLLDQVVAAAIDRGCREMSFGTSSPHDADLLRFKSQWGCAERPVYHCLTPGSTAPDLETSYGAARAVFARIPLFILKPLMRVVIPQLV